ncbi:hypothetical protein OG906_42990 (plasmid) [Streptomyces sp. NBC_01426]|nr:hypothetical protein [Streptomyces sp. NBC_01426]
MTAGASSLDRPGPTVSEGGRALVGAATPVLAADTCGAKAAA